MREISYLEAIREALHEEMKRNEKMVTFGEGFISVRGGPFGILKGFQDEFGAERVRDTPISESAIIGCALGAALTGLTTAPEIQFMDWITLGMDQIVNQVAKVRYISGGKVKVPVVIRAPFGALGSLGPHHSQSFESWFVHVPGLKVALPSTPYDAKGLLKTALRDSNPVLYLEHRGLYRVIGPVPQEEYTIPFGQADIKREGEDVTIVATSKMVHLSIEAAKELNEQGISVEVLDPRTLVPFDRKMLVDSVKKTGRVVIVHEAPRTGGVAGEIAAILMEEAFDYLDAPIQRVTGLDTPIPLSPPLEKYVLPDKRKIVKAVNDVLR